MLSETRIEDQDVTRLIFDPGATARLLQVRDGELGRGSGIENLAAVVPGADHVQQDGPAGDAAPCPVIDCVAFPRPDAGLARAGVESARRVADMSERIPLTGTGPRRVAKFEGRRALIDGIESVMVEQGAEQRRHHIGNIVLDIFGPAVVQATAYASLVIIGASGVAVQASAIYNADLEFRDGIWRFAKVIVGLDGYMGTPPER